MNFHTLRNTNDAFVPPKPKKGWQLIHRCHKCGNQAVNKVAVDTVQPDDFRKLAMI
jgi:hypothetical protein